MYGKNQDSNEMNFYETEVTGKSVNMYGILCNSEWGEFNTLKECVNVRCM